MGTAPPLRQRILYYAGVILVRTIVALLIGLVVAGITWIGVGHGYGAVPAAGVSGVLLAIAAMLVGAVLEHARENQ